MRETGKNKQFTQEVLMIITRIIIKINWNNKDTTYFYVNENSKRELKKNSQ